jgi:putative addiction module component (TIGR02574 family)
MPIVDELKQMSLSEKLGLMEALWDELSRKEDGIPMPDGHKKLLNEREHQAKDGSAKFIPWKQAKERILTRIFNRE